MTKSNTYLLPKELGNKRNFHHSLFWDQSMRKKRFNIILSSQLLLIATLAQAATDLPPSAKVDMGPVEEVCSEFTDPEWRKEQVIDGVTIQESKLCNPDNPADIAAFVKGTNGVSMDTLMQTQLATDAVTLSA